MNEITFLKVKLTDLQENILIELNKTFNIPFICKKLNIKPITISKTIQVLTDKKLVENNQLTSEGKKMVHYLEFRYDTISSFLKKLNITPSIDNINQFSKLDFNTVISIKNIL